MYRYSLRGEHIAHKHLLNILGLEASTLDGSWIGILVQLFLPLSKLVEHTLDGMGAKLNGA